LETAKEELQSANEELTTINDELQARNAEMSQLTNDLTNLLLTSAIKFTLPGGKVTVRARELNDPARLEIQVQDTGKGIEPEFLPHVFKRFSQEDSSAKRAFGGLGLGLSITRSLVELHGGTVTADSPGTGKGSTFTVTLPRGRKVGATAESDQDMAGLTEEAPVELTGLRVLIVDDDEDARDALSALLESLGAQVQTAESAQKGLTALTGDHTDVVLCDLGMPGEDGFSMIRQVRALEPGHGGNMPVVALTAYADRANIQRCLEAGFNAHLAKPMDAMDLARLIAGLVGRSNPTP
jgi:CheY-like chemotaxis protein